MGYRERRAHKSQQKQESLGQSYQSDSRASIPAPMGGMNTRENIVALPLSDAALLEDAIPTDSGLLIKRDARKYAYASATSTIFVKGLVSYQSSGSASAELWLFAGGKIYDIGETNGQLVSASAISAPNDGGSQTAMWTEFNKTIIYVNGGGASQTPYKWNRASGWESWSATASGGAVANFWGINKFKSRLIGWEQDDNKFWYGSADQVLGTFNSFDLSDVMRGNLVIMANMTRDGGAGPDDYAVFISDEGNAVVYQGNDPGDANNWSLVGSYQIGRPVSRKSYVSYGQQLVVLCEDDFYFLPMDLQGKRSSTKAAERRLPDINSFNDTQGIFDPRTGLIVFTDGSVLSPKHNFAYSNVHLGSADPYILRATNGQPQANQAAHAALWRGDMYFAPGHGTDVNLYVYQFDPDDEFDYRKNARIRTAPIPTQGRTNISMVNPVFKSRTPSSATQDSISLKVIYRTAVVYDQEFNRYHSASADAWVTSTASTNSDGLWVPGYGTGDNAQIYVDVLTCSASTNARTTDLFLTEIKVAISDTGGI